MDSEDFDFQYITNIISLLFAITFDTMGHNVIWFEKLMASEALLFHTLYLTDR